jgi:hypothetical protein
MDLKSEYIKYLAEASTSLNSTRSHLNQMVEVLRRAVPTNATQARAVQQSQLLISQTEGTTRRLRNALSSLHNAEALAALTSPGTTAQTPTETSALETDSTNATTVQ